MKNFLQIISVLLTALICNALHAQTSPAIEWQKSFGGSNDERARCIQQSIDGGFIVAGYSSSNNGDVTGNHDANDCWIVKLDAAGNISWQKSLGGSEGDEAYSIHQTADDGFIVAGLSSSNDGDVSNHHGTSSYEDYWIMKLDADGNLVWQKSLGGTNRDFASSIQQTSDGGFIVAGDSWSSDGDVTGHHGSTTYNDSWIVKLDMDGDLVWQKSLGGSSYDYVHAVQQTVDGGFLVVGDSYSNDGDVSGNHGGFDYWIVKLNPDGNLVWQESLGGSEADFGEAMQQTPDGGFIIAGISYSNDGDVSGNHGGYDDWIIKLDAEGNLVWQKSLGGNTDDVAFSIRYADGGFIVAGYSDSDNGDVSGNHALYDYWVLKTDTTGNLLWQKSLGGSYEDQAYSIQQTIDGGFIVAGNSSSNDGDVSGNHQGADYWIVKLTSDTISGVAAVLQNSVSVYPNPVQDFLTIDLGNEIMNPIISVYDLQGRKMDWGFRNANFRMTSTIQLNAGNLPNGFYTLQIVDDKTGKSEVRKFVKQ